MYFFVHRKVLEAMLYEPPFIMYEMNFLNINHGKIPYFRHKKGRNCSMLFRPYQATAKYAKCKEKHEQSTPNKDVNYYSSFSYILQNIGGNSIGCENKDY